MGDHENNTVRRLLQAFMTFRKAAWKPSPVAGCKMSGLMVLFVIKKGTTPDKIGMKASEISRILKVTSPTVTQMIKNLEASGLVERRTNPEDRRETAIRLTEKGEKVRKKMEVKVMASFKGLVDYLGEEESNHLTDLLTKVYDYFDSRDMESEVDRT
ncbi:DNA-binding MarR family transcriptional regulator [Scopulibacillus darangshiensis]|uniref:DNA-binding MarR family transcriptional regulator n=1 Tax=Scopulibacillus darangshiensis TaxID=442528 RepID=A0A4R2NGC7_9BACL|nr:MarR family transcriptional regulator [Scopulibacillus darangshiensis]TCP20350.1 DNA-binding MarR family transcriptional regulator [Scopulibacillus darangshiensis]